MISKAIEIPITNTAIKKLKLHRGGYEWSEAGGITRNDGPTIFYLLFKSINLDTRIGVSNLKYEI